MLEVSTTRKGPSGTSYSIRLVQCEPRRFGYIADAETKSALVLDPSPALSELVSGSISDVIAEHACETEAARLEAKAERDRMHAEKQAAKEKAQNAERKKIKAEIAEDIDFLRWSDALVKFRRLAGFTELDAQYRAEIETKILSLVKPLP